MTDDLIRRADALNVVNEAFMTQIYKAIEAIPSAQPKQGEWIPCEERLPEHERRRYWVCTDTQYQCECRWTNNIYGLRESDDWGWSIVDTPQYTKVLAWMPLPQPYEIEQTERSVQDTFVADGIRYMKITDDHTDCQWK